MNETEDEIYKSEMDYFLRSKDTTAWKIFVYIMNRKTDDEITYEDWDNAVYFFSKNKLCSRAYRNSLSWPLWWGVMSKAYVLKSRPGQEITKKSIMKVLKGKHNPTYLRTINKINSSEYVKRNLEKKMEEAVDNAVTKFALKKIK